MKPKLVAHQMRIMGWGFILFGVVFVTIAFTGYDSFARTLVPLFDWTGAAADETLTRSGRWYAAIMSGLSAGFGAFYAFLVAPLLALRDKAVQQIARRGGLMAAFIWYIIDNAGSWAADVPSNIATNTIFLILIAVPLLMLKVED